MTISERQMAVIGGTHPERCCATCELAFPHRMVVNDHFGIRMSRDDCYCSFHDATIWLNTTGCPQWRAVPGWVRSGQETIGI